jgi:hypothetical protein
MVTCTALLEFQTRNDFPLPEIAGNREVEEQESFIRLSILRKVPRRRYFSVSDILKFSG